MSEIKVRNLVYVARPSSCKGRLDGLGYIFIVEDIRILTEGRCEYCGFHHDDGPFAWDGEFWWAIRRLRKIDPLQEPESIEREMETL